MMCEMFCQHQHVACHLIRHDKAEQNARAQAVTFEGAEPRGLGFECEEQGANFTP